MKRKNGIKIRRMRVRKKLKTVGSLPRLSIFRSNKNIYAQVIDDKTGTTLASASTQSKELKGKYSSVNLESAKAVGSLVAKNAKKNKVENVFFDRGSYLYHGRVKALADAAREEGLAF